MAFTPDSLSEVFQTIGGTWHVFFYATADSKTALQAGNYFLRAGDSGVHVGDMIIVLSSVETGHFSLCVTAVSNIGTASVELEIDSAAIFDFDVIAGVMRQNPVDRTQWEFLNDSAHKPENFDPDPTILASDGTTVLNPHAAGNNLLAFYKIITDAKQIDVNSAVAYDHIGAVIVAADEILTKDWGIKVGAQVTRTGVVIQGSMSKTRMATTYNNGSAWLHLVDPKAPAGTLSASYSAGVLTVDHDWLPGDNLQVCADCRTGLIPTVLIPIIHTVSDTQFKVGFQDPGSSSGDVYTGAAGTKLSVRWAKTYNGPLWMDGTNGFDAVPWSTSDAGNIWVLGLMWR